MHLEQRVLVFGGAGVLGSYLCEQPLERGCQVLCVDNFFTGTRRNGEAHRVLNWRPTISLKQGLATTIAYFEKLIVEQWLREQWQHELGA